MIRIGTIYKLTEHSDITTSFVMVKLDEKLDLENARYLDNISGHTTIIPIKDIILDEYLIISILRSNLQLML